MKNIFEIVFSKSENLLNITLLRKLLFIYVIINFIQLIPFVSELYSVEYSIIFQRELSAVTINSLVNLLAFKELKNLYWLFFALQVLFSVAGILGYFTRISTMVVWFTTINLQNRIYSGNTGGDLLLNILLFYLIFISDGRKLKNDELEKIKNSIDFCFINLCKFQLIIVYFISALYKVTCNEWIDGTALARILFVNEYSLPIISDVASAYSTLFKIITWLILAYQILFPLVLIKSNKVSYLLMIGILFHVGIALFMGLFNFSLIMIISYVIFIPTYHLKEFSLAKFLVAKE